MPPRLDVVLAESARRIMEIEAIDEKILTSVGWYSDASLPPEGLDNSVFVDEFVPSSEVQASVALVCHVYYVDFVKTIIALLKNLPDDIKIFITTDEDDKKKAIEHALLGLGKPLHVLIVENRGRDILPKLAVLDELAGQADVALFLHSKKSLHSSYLSDWQSHLLTELAGTQSRVRAILGAFACDPRLGMVAAQHFAPVRPHCLLGRNLRLVSKLAKRAGLDMAQVRFLDFPSGSMFWCRPEALRSLVGLGLDRNNFPDELGQTDGTMAHAIERLFFVFCEISGFKWFKVALDPGAAKSELRSGEDLRRYLDAIGNVAMIPAPQS